MSPELAVIPMRRVIRSAAMTQVAATSFPTIVEAPKPVAQSTAPGHADHDTAGAPAPAPVIDAAVLEAARLEAAARGYEDGHAAGRDEAIASVRQDAQMLLAQLGAAVQSLEDGRQVSFDRLTDDVARFAFATVEAILDRELALAGHPVRDAIERALRVAPNRLDAVVVVHPDDLETLGAVDDIAGARTVEIVTDNTIERGGCIVRIADCEIDAQLSRALDRLRGVLQIDGGSSR
jgi:flagellar assembly protein FliH